MSNAIVLIVLTLLVLMDPSQGFFVAVSARQRANQMTSLGDGARANPNKVCCWILG